MLSEKVLFALNNIDDAYLEETKLFLQRSSKVGKKLSGKRIAKSILIAAILSILMAAAAYAVGYTIHQRRQEEMREQLQIEENQVPGYTEYALPESASGKSQYIEVSSIHLLSSFYDGKIVNAYVSVAPLTREEAWDAVFEHKHGMLSYRISNKPGLELTEPAGRGNPEAFSVNSLMPPIPEGLSMADISREAYFDHYYDSETLSLFVQLGFLSDQIDLSQPVYLNICLLDYESLSTSMNNWLDENFSSYHPVIIRNFGTAEISTASTAYREADFRSSPLEIINPVNHKALKTLSARVYPTRIEWIVVHDDLDGLYYVKKDKASLERSFALQAEWQPFYDQFLEGANLLFDDGTVTNTMSEDCSSYDGNELTLYSNWVSTISLDRLTGLRIGDQTFFLQPAVSVLPALSGAHSLQKTAEADKTSELPEQSAKTAPLLPEANTSSEITAPGFIWYSDYDTSMQTAEENGFPEYHVSMIDDISLVPHWDYYRNTKTDYYYDKGCGGQILFPNAGINCFGYQIDQCTLYYLYDQQSGIRHDTKAEAVRLYMVEYVIHTGETHNCYLDLLSHFKELYGENPIEEETGVCWINAEGALVGFSEIIHPVNEKYSAVKIIFEAPGAEEKLNDLVAFIQKGTTN